MYPDHTIMLCLVGENGMEWNEYNNLKLIEIRGKFWNKCKWEQNCYDEIWEEIGVGENGAFHLKLKVWSLAHNVKNGMDEWMKFVNNCP